MTKGEEIIRSWFISINPTDEQVIKSIHRMDTCLECEHKKDSEIFSFSYCDKCGCPLRKKVFTPKEDGCPLGKW
jgi:hypothetical protein